MQRQWPLLVFASIALSGPVCLMAGQGTTTGAGAATRTTCLLLPGRVVASHRQLAHPIATTVSPSRIQQIQFQACPDDLPVPAGYQAVDIPPSATKLWNVAPERGHSLRTMQVHALRELYRRPVASASPDRAIVPRGTPHIDRLASQAVETSGTFPPPSPLEEEQARQNHQQIDSLLQSWSADRQPQQLANPKVEQSPACSGDDASSSKWSLRQSQWLQSLAAHLPQIRFRRP